MRESTEPGRTVRLPYSFGDIVYHRVKTEKLAGMVTGFSVRERGLMVCVVWADGLNESFHHFFELTTEFESKIE
jgi:hypothetical protein